jgi:four helix bundle protein
MDLVTATYRATGTFPKEEQFGLTSQLRRAAVSIPSNIAEGQGRLSEKEFRHFLGQARGSLMEVETQLQIAQNLGYVQPTQTSELLKACGEVGRILNGLLASICKPPNSEES